MAQQGSGPPRFGRAPAPRTGNRRGYFPEVPDEPSQDEDYPSWAIPDAMRSPRRADPQRPADPRQPVPQPAPRPGRWQHERQDYGEEQGQPPSQDPGGRRRRGPGRAQATRVRRAKRRVITWGGLAAAAAAIAALVIFLVSGGSTPSSARNDGFITTYQRGELKSVPSTCGSVSTGTLGQYLPGKLTRAVLPGVSGNSSNQCAWTLDHRPMYRLLQVSATAYAPSGLATGNGSATSAAQDAYSAAMQAQLHPPRGTHQPKAQMAGVPGLGTAAFSGFQVIAVGGDRTDRVTLVVRFRNVVIAVQFSGLDHARRGGYGPVSPSLLQAGALAAAKDVLAKIS
ncbi:MAG TPA: hypothetical protein VGI74_27510 [Streptosporangiaceae bacterium]